MGRNTAIEIHIDITGIPQSILDKYDIEYYAAKKTYALWLHPGGKYKPFDRELFNYLSGIKKVINRRTKTDHLDLFIEAAEIDEFGIEINEIKYKNIRASELQNVDLTKVKLKREL